MTAHPPELIVFSDSAPYALKILEKIKRRRALKGIPLIVLTEKEKDSYDTLKNVVTINRACHERFLIQTIRKPHRTLQTVQEYDCKPFKTVSGKGNRILIIDRFHHFSKNNIKALTDYGFEVSVNTNEDDILTKTERVTPGHYLVDEEMEQINLVSLCRSINLHKAINAIPKIIVTSSRKIFEQVLFAGFLCRLYHQTCQPRTIALQGI